MISDDLISPALGMIMGRHPRLMDKAEIEMARFRDCYFPNKALLVRKDPAIGIGHLAYDLVGTGTAYVKINHERIVNIITKMFMLFKKSIFILSKR